MAQEIRAEEFFGKASRRRPEEFEFVRYRVEGPVARMTLDRPEHNLLNETMLRELSAGIESLGQKDDVKLVVLDAAGEVFCGGIGVGGDTPPRGFPGFGAFPRGFFALLQKGKTRLGVVKRPTHRRGAGAAGIFGPG